MLVPVRSSHLTRRRFLHVSTAPALAALLAACGQQPTDRPPTASPAPTRVATIIPTPSTAPSPSLATPTDAPSAPAPTRLVIIPTPLPTATAIAASSVAAFGPVELVWEVRQGLSYPWGIAVDQMGNVCVTDSMHDRVVKFDTTGKMLTAWGSPGTEVGQFTFWQGAKNASRIAVDDRGRVYVSDFARVQVFDGAGQFVRSIGTVGTGTGQFIQPAHMAIDAQGNLYVTDVGSDRVQKFDRTGQFVLAWGSKGKGDGEFDRTNGIAVNHRQEVLVTDVGTPRIQVFDPSGGYLQQWPTGVPGGARSTVASMAADGADNVYITINPGDGVEEYDAHGTLVARWGSHGEGRGQLNIAGGIAVDGEGNIYIANIGNSSVQKFRPK